MTTTAALQATTPTSSSHHSINRNVIYTSDDDSDDDDDSSVDSQSTTQTANKMTSSGNGGGGGGQEQKETAGGGRESSENEDLLAIRQQAFDLLNKTGGPSTQEDAVSWPTDPQLLDEIQQQQQAARLFEQKKLLEEQQQASAAAATSPSSSSTLSWREKLAKENQRQSRLRAKMKSNSPVTNRNSDSGKKFATPTSAVAPSPPILTTKQASVPSSSSSYQHQSAGESAGREGSIRGGAGGGGYQNSSTIIAGGGGGGGSGFGSNGIGNTGNVVHPNIHPSSSSFATPRVGDELSVTELFTNCVSSICKSTSSYVQQTDVMNVISQGYQSIAGTYRDEHRLNGVYDPIDTSQHGYGNNNNNNNSRSTTATGNKYGGYSDSGNGGGKTFRGRYTD